MMLCRRDPFFTNLPAQHGLWQSHALIAAWIMSAVGNCLREETMRTARTKACVSADESASLAKGHIIYIRLRDVLTSVQVLIKPLSSTLFRGEEAVRKTEGRIEEYYCSLEL